MKDFLDNMGNHQHQKMLREIANDDQTPKKRDLKVENDLYEPDGLDYEVDLMAHGANSANLQEF